MTLRCPNCNSKRLLYLSTTDGTAVGSTDQRYLCKECGYRGSLVLDDSPKKTASREKRARIPRLLQILDLALFIPVLYFFFSGGIETPPGIILLLAWVVTFVLTWLSLTADHVMGSAEWYQYSSMLVTASFSAIVIGIILSFDIYGILMLLPFSLMAVFVFTWMFSDHSEEEVEKDLNLLKKELD